ncbi:MAG: hypothetical protein WHX52_14085 [Anaerolineae bacterium]
MSMALGVGLVILLLGLCAPARAMTEGGAAPRVAATHTGSPTLQETQPLTPTPTLDIYNLPGDYGEVGRLFDFAVILAIVQGFLDIIGVSNLRDFLAISAALAVIVSAVVRPASEE